jgi:hypothetical protein
MIYDGSLKSRFRLSVEIARQLIGDIFSLGMVSRALHTQADGWAEANRLLQALEEIADCETAGANGTVKRMAKMANAAIKGDAECE